ncbi:MAG TPA: SMC-Scp complex subunit ScpB [Agitococcus sp.]|uniref:SMC-Scp complex subunit ScpB n=1 Tax=uncultured Agitococcus sp. TaxID=1506599 RepID=UPI0026394518|nr:SMC-Scp complex subunit ScpB [uncultured Agitococcus sp.]HMU87181.1 SMC-Scp complex subunit ScpB [Agitococcus sp.]HMV60828.1 SMC-Scp complex subunit ScpB [Agitococcus sp.]HMX99049.1 SMC-Scp complex subunit ScpB [Agitococcus sp.]HMY82189.1 SMC-Scp complex subunit ScpB [Agitococcus sp.]HNA21203.1 SMC-Scp complex subunit ScpB [Agitococcus sp.]
MKLSQSLLKNILESAIFASPSPLSVEELLSLFADEEKPTRQQIQTLIKELQNDYATRPLEVVEVASGYRFQVRAKFSPWISKMWQDKPPKLSRAMLETLAIIAYRQPVTRAEIEAIRGVVVSTQIIKALFDRDWIVVVGHREVPGRPALLATTREFLDAFSLKGLADLPPLAALRDLDTIEAELATTNRVEKE